MECHQVRDYSEFYDQLSDVRDRFYRWDSCERTVALYYLMTGLPFANARFLLHALEQCVQTVNTPEAQILEHNANNPVFVVNLLCERPQVALNSLLVHLPLLKPGNRDAVKSYLSTIRKVLMKLVAPPFKIYNECVEIMSYVFIHPAFNKDDKKSFRQLLKKVINQVSPENFVHSPMNESSDESVSPNPEPSNPHTINDTTRMNRRSNSLTPTQTNSYESLILTPPESCPPHENIMQQAFKPRSYSLSHDPVFPSNIQSTLHSSSSETRLQDLHVLNDSSANKSVLQWLKSLRLHKYGWVFHNLTYEQMVNLTEETLQMIGITKGARHKILLSIGKLKERRCVITELETEVMNGGDLLCALKKLKGVLQTPLQMASSEEDLTSQFVKVMGKVVTQLLMRRQPSEECIQLFLSLSDRIEGSEVFTDEHKRRIAMWSEQLVQVCHVPTYVKRQQTASNYRNLWMTAKSSNCNDQIHSHKSSSYPNVQHNQPNEHRHSVGSITVQNVFQSRQIQELQAKQLQQKSESPIFVTCDGPLDVYQYHHHVRFQDTERDWNVKNQKLKSVDIESSLESLCLQMTEHALGP